MLVKLTQDDIEMGLRYSHNCCPVSKAVMRALGEQGKFFSVSIGLYIIKIDKNNIGLPKFVTQWIEAFDRGEKVSPVEFEI